MYPFLAASSILLGFAVSMAYFFLEKYSGNDAIMSQLLEKLRVMDPTLARKYDGLPAARRERLLFKDRRLRNVLTKQDFRILKQVQSRKLMMAILVYGLAFAFIVAGVALLDRP